ncbi:UNVERIFIED_CONTAM: hypothetical protein FKN15_039752 [Acipenser sinensis]
MPKYRLRLYHQGEPLFFYSQVYIKCQLLVLPLFPRPRFFHSETLLPAEQSVSLLSVPVDQTVTGLFYSQ